MEDVERAVREVPLHGNRKHMIEGKGDVLADGKKYELAGLAAKTGLLTPGDYKARFVQDEDRTTYDSPQEYEFLFPDKRLASSSSRAE
jgi:hypothetical protein